MPSSLIIVALAVAWLVVLVPMVARKRQEVVHTTDSALAARVVRSGNIQSEEVGEELFMSEATQSEAAAGGNSISARGEDIADDNFSEASDDPHITAAVSDDQESLKHRPGRGGFNPEAAELAARAKYVYRQRIVLMMIVTAVITAVTAGFLWSMLWWVHGMLDVGLVAYLGYLRRQVRIEEDIRQRRLARYRERAHDSESVQDTFYEEVATTSPERGEDSRSSVPIRNQESAPVIRAPRRIRDAVVVHFDDEDPAFHDLQDPGQLQFRRAVGE